MKAALRVSRNCRAHLSDFYVAPWSACLHAFRVTPGTRKAVLRPLPQFNCSNGIKYETLLCSIIRIPQMCDSPSEEISCCNQLELRLHVELNSLGLRYADYVS